MGKRMGEHSEEAHRAFAQQHARGVTLPHLHAWRVYRYLSQTELARQAGVARTTVTRAEKGELISFASVRALAKALDITERQLQRETPPDSDVSGAA